MAKKQERAPAPLDLAPRLAERGLEPLYLLEGPESYLRARALDELRRFAGTKDVPADLADFEGEKAELALVLDEVRTIPFFSGSRLVFVRDADALLARNPEGVEAFLGELAARSGPARCALILAAEKLDGRLRVTKRVREAACLVTCETPDAIGLLRFVRDLVRARGRTFENGADSALMERFSGGAGVAADMALLEREVSKLASAGDGPITLAQVDSLASALTAEDTFAIVSAIGRGDAKGALESLRSVLRDGAIVDGDRKRDPKALAPIILGILTWDLGRAFRAKALLDSGGSAQEAVQEARAWRDRDAFIARIRSASQDTLRRQHALLREADAIVKESGDPFEILTTLVARLALENRPTALRRAYAR
ncbi:DNA polymerase III subunit delta [bacterium]|nr:DNA polymerase III subunit delta [bacterium]